MRTNPIRRLFSLGAFIAAVVAGAPVAAAAPSINVTVQSVLESSRQVRVKMTGSGFTPNSSAQFDVYFAGSNEYQGAFTFTANSAGKVNRVAVLDYTNACQLGIYAWDLATSTTSNWVDLDVPAPCKTPTITVKRHNNELDATMVTGVNFTPHGSGEGDANRAESYVTDINTGESWNNDTLPVFGNGKTGFHRHWGRARCGHTLIIYMFDRVSQVWSNPVSFRLCQ